MNPSRFGISYVKSGRDGPLGLSFENLRPFSMVTPTSAANKLDKICALAFCL